METVYGQGALARLAPKDWPAPVALLASPDESNRALAALGFKPDAVVTVAEGATAEVAGYPTVIAVGDGLLIETARRARAAAPGKLVAAPSVICAEPFTGGLGAEVDLVIVDYSLIWGNREELSRASAGEILSIMTAAADWTKPDADGKPCGDSVLADEALVLVEEMMDWADELYELTESAIDRMFELFVKREDFVARAGSRRPVEGSEHIFLERAWPEVKGPRSRGALLCLGTILMGELQGKPSRPVKQYLYWIGSPWKPEDLGLDDMALMRIIAGLPILAREKGYGRILQDTAELKAPAIKELIGKMRESIIRNSFQDRDD